jgi:hypothetical protein
MDDRVYAMNLHKTMPNKYLMLCIYPHLYAIHNLDDKVRIYTLNKINEFLFLNIFILNFRELLLIHLKQKYVYHQGYIYHLKI